jgi:hypothetical protein
MMAVMRRASMAPHAGGGMGMPLPPGGGGGMGMGPPDVMPDGDEMGGPPAAAPGPKVSPFQRRPKAIAGAKEKRALHAKAPPPRR